MTWIENDNNLELIEKLAEIMKKYVLDEVTVGDIKIIKKRHSTTSEQELEENKKKKAELLFGKDNVPEWAEGISVEQLLTDPFAKGNE